MASSVLLQCLQSNSLLASFVNIAINLTVFTKTDRNVTTTEIHFMINSIAILKHYPDTVTK